MSAIKKAVKSVGRFVRRHWKKLVVAAAVVFTAGVATVGLTGSGGFLSVAGTKGVLAAAGGALKAGVAAIGGTLGIGSGVTATTAGGMWAGSSAVGGALASGASGATLLNGAAAQALGIGKAAAAAKSAGSALSTAGTSTAAPLGSGITSAYGSGMSTAAGTTAPTGFSAPMADAASLQAQAQASVFGTNPLTSTSAFNAAMNNTNNTTTTNTTNIPTETTKAGGFMNSAVGSALVSGGLNAIGSYMAAQRAEDEDPINAMYGVSPDDRYASLTPDQVRFTSEPTSRSSWRPRLMYDA